jgi:hypothetical protein
LLLFILLVPKSAGGGNGVGVDAVVVTEDEPTATRLIGDCLAGYTNGARRRFAVEEGAGPGLFLLRAKGDLHLFLLLAGVLMFAFVLLLLFPFVSCPTCNGRTGVFDKENDGDDNNVDDVAVVPTVVAVSLLLLLALFLRFFFRIVPGGFKSW